MDTVADFLIRIKNSSLAERPSLTAPFSKFGQQLAALLQKEGLLDKVEVIEEAGHKKLLLSLAKKGNDICKIDVKRVSKPGRRVYAKASDLKKIRGVWITILSTPEGLFNAKEALKKNLGGEVICKIMKV